MAHGLRGFSELCQGWCDRVHGSLELWLAYISGSANRVTSQKTTQNVILQQFISFREIPPPKDSSAFQNSTAILRPIVQTHEPMVDISKPSHKSSYVFRTEQSPT